MPDSTPSTFPALHSATASEAADTFADIHKTPESCHPAPDYLPEKYGFSHRDNHSHQ